MASGKKVFTQAGEFLAEFLVKQQTSLSDTQKLLTTINDLNGTSTVNSTIQFQDNKFYTRQQISEYFKNELVKELGFVKVTDSQKELNVQEMTQYLYNTTKWLEVTNQAQFESLLEATALHFAEIYKKIGTNNRKTIMKTSELTNSIADMSKYTLDHFVGNTDTKDLLFFKTTGNQILINNGGGTGNKFFEVLQAKSITKNGANQAYIGDTLVIGGTESDSPFKRLTITKDIDAKGDIILVDGKELKGTALRARYADLAEYYTSDYDYRPGTLLAIDSQPNYEVTKFNPLEGCAYAGVVSDQPGFILNDDLQIKEPDAICLPVVLCGKSPVRVVGPTNKGDVLFSHPTISGVAISIDPKLVNEFILLNPYSYKVGIALESTIPFNIDDLSENPGVYIEERKEETLVMSKLS